MARHSLKRLTVLGAGVLGGQIAWHSAFKGKTVVVYDPYEQALERCKVAHQQYAQIYSKDLRATDAAIAATRGRISFQSELKPAVAAADLVIEAVPEIPDVKTRVYREMAGCLPAHTIVATNSSTLLPRDFAEATGRPDKYCALHFANLIWALNLAEIMAHPGTSQDTLTAVTGFAIEIGMVPIPVQREKNGYVLNSWFEPLLTAAQTLVTNGVSTPEDVDRTYMIVNRGCAMGPFGMIDMVGMKTVFDVSNHWGTVNKNEQMLKNAAYIKENFLDKGLQGAMGGRGYYRYPNPAYADPAFLGAPDLSAVPDLVRRATLKQ